MLELMGSGYVIEHCIAAFRKKQEEKTYRAYVTDALRVIGENVARNGGGAYIPMRWIDLIDTTPPPPEDKRSCAEQAADMWTRIRGEKK